MNRNTCIHNVDFDIECDLCWDQVEHEIALTKEESEESK
jgi:hypothetical protein